MIFPMHTDAVCPVHFIFFNPNLFLNPCNQLLLAVSGWCHFRGSPAEVFV